MSRRPALVLLSLLAAACSATADDGVDHSEDAFGDRVGHDALSTTEPGITLFDGYNTAFDLRKPACTRPNDDRKPSAGQAYQRTTIQVVRSDVELAKELGVDASFAFKAPLVSLQGSGSLLRSFKGSTSSVNYLIRAVQSYIVTNNGHVALTDDERSLMQSNPQEFLVRCGDRFVTGVTFEAKIEALITFETNSEERALKLQGSISGNGTAGVVNLDGSIKSQLTNTSKQQDVRTSVTVTAQGFDLAGDDALIGLGGTVEEKLTRIDQVAGQMGASLRADREHDANGFSTNLSRTAVPVAVHLARYGSADNAPPGVETTPAFRTNYDKLRETEKFVRDMSQLKLKMEHAYRYEIAEFQKAGPEAQSAYNLVEPAPPKRFASELRPIAAMWAERFRDDDGLNIGRDTVKVRDAMATCVKLAQVGDFSACGSDARSLPVYVEGMKAVDEYLTTGRIVKLRTFVIDTGAERGYEQAKGRCANIDGWVDRLPTAEEAARLAPFIAGYAGGSKKSIWTADTASCRFSSSQMSFYSNPLEGTPGQGCDRWSLFSAGSRATVCVPQSGPVGKRDEL
jgi:hypothetical protein